MLKVFLMMTIMATGNYNFFNLLFIALCVSLVDDDWSVLDYIFLTSFLIAF